MTDAALVTMTGVPMAMELDPVEDDDKDDDQPSTAANPYGALKARYDSLLQRALRIQNFLDDFANQLERVQARSVLHITSVELNSGMFFATMSGPPRGQCQPRGSAGCDNAPACAAADIVVYDLVQALLTWRDPTATRMVMTLCGTAAVAVGLLGLPTCLCAFLLYQVRCGGVPCAHVLMSATMMLENPLHLRLRSTQLLPSNVGKIRKRSRFADSAMVSAGPTSCVEDADASCPSRIFQAPAHEVGSDHMICRSERQHVQHYAFPPSPSGLGFAQCRRALCQELRQYLSAVLVMLLFMVDICVSPNWHGSRCCCTLKRRL